MINAVIVDDEQHSIDRLKRLLDRSAGLPVEITGTFTSVGEAVEGIPRLEPSLLFLDVQLHDKTGFDLLQMLGNIRFDVIFTTAYEKYAVQAFRFSAIDYLLKPIDRTELRQAIEKLTERRTGDDITAKLEILFHNLGTRGAPGKISVPTAGGFMFLEVDEIIRCQSDTNYTNILLKDGKTITVAKTLKEFEELLKDHDFYRVHKSHLVNLAYIKSYARGKSGWLTLSDGSEIEVSSRRKEGFLRHLAAGRN